jgi:hypothetical protein
MKRSVGPNIEISVKRRRIDDTDGSSFDATISLAVVKDMYKVFSLLNDLIKVSCHIIPKMIILDDDQKRGILTANITTPTISIRWQILSDVFDEFLVKNDDRYEFGFVTDISAWKQNLYSMKSFSEENGNPPIQIAYDTCCDYISLHSTAALLNDQTLQIYTIDSELMGDVFDLKASGYDIELIVESNVLKNVIKASVNQKIKYMRLQYDREQINPGETMTCMTFLGHTDQQEMWKRRIPTDLPDCIIGRSNMYEFSTLNKILKTSTFQGTSGIKKIIIMENSTEDLGLLVLQIHFNLGHILQLVIPERIDG